MFSQNCNSRSFGAENIFCHLKLQWLFAFVFFHKNIIPLKFKKEISQYIKYIKLITKADRQVIYFFFRSVGYHVPL